LVNYADDFVILSRGFAPEALNWSRSVLTRLGLTLNEEKTVPIRLRPTPTTSRVLPLA
jgi:hypothetical protein